MDDSTYMEAKAKGAEADGLDTLRTLKLLQHHLKMMLMVDDAMPPQIVSHAYKPLHILHKEIVKRTKRSDNGAQLPLELK